MIPTQETWDPVAKSLGYINERDMLEDLYTNQGLSISEVAAMLGYARGSVRRRLNLHRITTRPRGGKNNLGGGKLTEVPTNELKNWKEVCRKYGVHPSTVFNESRKRKEQEWNSVLSPPPPSSGSSSDHGSSASHSDASQTESTSSTTGNDVSTEPMSSSTTEPTKEPSEPSESSSNSAEK